MILNTRFSYRQHLADRADRIPSWLATRQTGALLVAAVLIVGTVNARAAEQSAPETSRLLHQNEFVTLELARLEPGDTVDLEDLTRTALYLLGDGQGLVRSAEGAKDIAAHARGDILPLRNNLIELHNAGESTLEYLFIRSLVSPLAADPPGPSEYLVRTVHTPPVPGEHGVRQVFDDEAFRIIEIVLPPGSRMSSIVHLSGVYFALNDHQGELVFTDERTESYRRESGDAWWMDSDEYAIRNPGRSPMHFVFMGIKPVARYGEYEP